MNWRHCVPLLLFTLLLAGCPAPSTVPNTKTFGPPRVKETCKVTFMDVGQGDAALVELPQGKSLLIDGGPPEAGPVVLEHLRAAGIQKLTWIVASHPHSDHIGGLVDVLREMPVERAFDPGYNHGTSLQKTYLGLLKSKGVRTERAGAGQRVELGAYEPGYNANLEFWAPISPLLKGTDSDANNNSIVALFQFDNIRFLFTGDMEEDGRARLLKDTSAADLRADVLKVAHHGSRNGTDAAFLEAVRPKYAVLSLAKHNDYGHPHRETLEALQEAGVQVLRTDERGDVVFTTDGTTLTLSPSSPQRRKGTQRAAEEEPRGRRSRKKSRNRVSPSETSGRSETVP